MMDKTELQTEILRRKEADFAYLLLSDEQIEAEILAEQEVAQKKAEAEREAAAKRKADEEQEEIAQKNAATQTSALSSISIDRGTPFNPEKFIGKGWSIVEQDETALALTKLDLSKIRFEPMLWPGETSLQGEEKLKRLKIAGHIRLDAKVLQTLWENKQLIPENWKEKTNNQTTFIFFDGTVVRNPHGSHCVLYLYWNGGEWYWHYDWLENVWHPLYPSAVLASPVRS